MKKRGLLYILLLCCEVAFATHIIGGNLSSVQTGPNNFTISLNLYRDCAPGNVGVENAYLLNVVDAVTLISINIRPRLERVSRDTVELSTRCFIPRNICIEEYKFSVDILLPNNPNGYKLLASTCCRNRIINNIISPGSAGIVWSMEIPDPALAGGNNSPNLQEYPPDGFLCANYLLTIDFSATDSDGDSLSYRLVDPHDDKPSLLPSVPIRWVFGYSAQTPITGTPGLTLDATTGIASCKADQLGIYVLAYEVREFRNGRLIGSVRRDIQVQVLGCTIDIPPVITSPTDSIFTFALGEQQCITLSAIDSNTTDTLNLIYSINSTAQSTATVRPTSGRITGIGAAETQICWEPDCTDLLGGQKFTILAKVKYSGCDTDSSIEKTFVYGIDKTIPEITAVLPNVFTPNGDGISEVLKPLVAIEERCAGKLSISIYNRWGQLMYTDYLVNLNWDGTTEGKIAAEGVYFYTVSGTYASEATNLKGYFTLIR